jgi:hypothetical protein
MGLLELELLLFAAAFFVAGIVMLPMGLVLRNDALVFNAAADFTALGGTCSITSIQVRQLV